VVHNAQMASARHTIQTNKEPAAGSKKISISTQT